jgi:hypothetical protein
VWVCSRYRNSRVDISLRQMLTLELAVAAVGVVQLFAPSFEPCSESVADFGSHCFVVASQECEVMPKRLDRRSSVPGQAGLG